MTYKCPRCSTRVKDWSGDDPKCGFSENGNALRDMEGQDVWCDDTYVKVVSRCDVGHGILSWYKRRGRTDEFRNGWFEKGTLRFAQELLGDVEPDYSDWENVDLGEDEE